MSARFLPWRPLGEYAHAAVSWVSFCEANFLHVDASQPVSSQDGSSLPGGEGV